MRYASPAGSPKLYDGLWIKMQRDLFTSIHDDTVIADCHFNEGKKLPGFPRCFCPFPHPSSCVDDSGQTLAVLTKEQEKNNAAVSHARARIESVYGQLKQAWACLREPWAEGIDQLEYAIVIAIGLRNLRL